MQSACKWQAHGCYILSVVIAITFVHYYRVGILPKMAFLASNHALTSDKPRLNKNNSKEAFVRTCVVVILNWRLLHGVTSPSQEPK